MRHLRVGSPPRKLASAAHAHAPRARRTGARDGTRRLDAGAGAEARGVHGSGRRSGSGSGSRARGVAHGRSAGPGRRRVSRPAARRFLLPGTARSDASLEASCHSRGGEAQSCPRAAREHRAPRVAEHDRGHRAGQLRAGGAASGRASTERCARGTTRGGQERALAPGAAGAPRANGARDLRGGAGRRSVFSGSAGAARGERDGRRRGSRRRALLRRPRRSVFRAPGRPRGHDGSGAALLGAWPRARVRRAHTGTVTSLPAPWRA